MRFWRPHGESGTFADGTAPLRYPRSKPRERSEWDNAARSLAGLLRHGALDAGLHMDRGGWVRIDELLKGAWATWRYKPLWNYGPTVAWICGVVASDFKGRFQLCLAFERYQDAGGASATGLTEAWPFAIRATSGHSIRGLNDERIYHSLTQEALGQISALTHQTRLENVLSIFVSGLLPGGGAGSNSRVHNNLAPFLPTDKRNVVGGRPSASYNTILVFNKAGTAISGDLSVSEGGVIVGGRPISASLIDQVIVDSPLYGSEKGNCTVGVCSTENLWTAPFTATLILARRTFPHRFQRRPSVTRPNEQLRAHRHEIRTHRRNPVV